MADHTTLHINCKAEQKEAWMLSARISNMSFEDWVKQRLDDAVIDANPEWAAGLSERARVCLLSAGFTSREAVQQAIADKYNFFALQNAGPRVESEVLQWAK